MNWSRARAILILGYLILDVFLGYTAFAARGAPGQVTSTEVQRAVEQLKAQGISVAAQVPRQVMAASFLSVKMGQTDPQQVVKKLLGPGEHVAQSAPEITVWTDAAGARVTLLATGVILYDAVGVESSGRQRFDERSARAFAEKYITSRGLMPPDARFDFVKQTGPNQFVVQYYQDYRGTPLFGGYVTAMVDGAGVSRLRIAWFTPVDAPEKRRIVVPVTDALVKAIPAMSKVLPGEATLENIRFGYLAEAMDARQWDAYPVWRLEFQDGILVYLNGYTGDMEKYEDIK